MPKRLNENAPYFVQMRAFEKTLLREALIANRGRLRETAATLGISPAYLSKRVRFLDLRNFLAHGRAHVA